MALAPIKKSEDALNYKLLEQWQPMALGDDNPFISNAFLCALESAGICSAETGWQPLHIELDERLRLPAYIKDNSWGEYVFDWSWADAYQQHNLDYYPKLLIAAPFTPSVGPRLINANESDATMLFESLKDICKTQELSGFHILFANQQDQQLLDKLPLLQRHDIQYHWQNQNYQSFEHFLQRFKSRKRKNIKKERKAVSDQGIRVATIQGAEISQEQLNVFYHYYHATYLKRGRQGYLNRAFFQQILQAMPEKLVLFMAYLDEQPVAAALCFQDQECLYGRYWGCLEEYNQLHFEVCYYHGIDYCITTGRKRFDPGAQGEHKISRGFEPVITRSYHWLANKDFFAAAESFCQREKQYVEKYRDDVIQSLPFSEQ